MVINGNQNADHSQTQTNRRKSLPAKALQSQNVDLPTKKRRNSVPTKYFQIPYLSFTKPIRESGHNLLETVLQMIIWIAMESFTLIAVLWKSFYFRVLHKILLYFNVKYTKFDDVQSPSEDHKIFYNWGLTVKCEPKKIIYCTNKQQIKQCIREAKTSKCNVRVAQYTHSWSPLFGDNSADYYILALIPKELRGLKPKIERYEALQRYNTDLSKVCIAGFEELMFVQDMGNNRIKVGGATPIWLYVNWFQKRLKSGLITPSEPCNVQQFHQTFAGTVAVSSHGGGTSNRPMCDYVISMTVINSDGKEVVYRVSNIRYLWCVVPTLKLYICISILFCDFNFSFSFVLFCFDITFPQ